MWTIEEFRLIVLFGTLAFITLTAVACFIGQAIQNKKCNELLRQAELLEARRGK